MFSNNLVTVVVTILTLVSHKVCLGQTPCTSTGWFGEDCKYQCHCAGGADCDKLTGSCGSVGCNSDWFGPACQYARIGYLNTLPGFDWFRDNNDETCNTGNTQYAPAVLNTDIPLTWVRVVVRNKADLSDINLSYQLVSTPGFVACGEIRKATVDDTTLDIVCPTTTPINQVALSGSGVRGLCSLYINGGRNVALKQTAEQSTTVGTLVASNALDGRSGEQEVFQNTCSSTFSFTDPWWRVTFSQPVDITWFLIHNRYDCCQFRMRNFKLTAYPGSSNSVSPWTHTDPDTELLTYTVVPSPKISFPVSQVRVDNKDGSPQPLELCEVFVYGETSCPSGYFGLGCERQCNCANGGDCFVHSGGCPSGCAPGFTGEDCETQCQRGTYGAGCSASCSINCAGSGNLCHHVDGYCVSGCDSGFYGKKCSDSCSSHCARDDNSCERVTGACIGGCDPGYRGDLCDENCLPGKYGAGCLQICKETCGGWGNPCHHVTGRCSAGCDAGYTGEFCDQICPLGKYGTGCSLDCKETCGGSGNPCHHVTGRCSAGCDAGYTGEFCDQNCPLGKYGTGCSLDCKETCGGSGNPCHHVTGRCSAGCDDGYTGEFCEQICLLGKYGAGCSLDCKKTCGGSGNPCHHVTGTCSAGCDAGYTGEFCDQICLLGKYGAGCSLDCKETCGGSGNPCHHVTGRCSAGCDAGYTGELCDQNCATGTYGAECSGECNVNCGGSGNYCHHITGTCESGCDPGYRDDKCDQECQAGTYGAGCDETCSEHCAGHQNPSCHHVNGTCARGCGPGYLGFTCKEECSPTTWGQDCSQNCSTTCVHNNCDNVSGACVCATGYQGELCDQICSAGTYGDGCEQTCSLSCLDKLCHHVTGTCDACIEGRSGATCASVLAQKGGQGGGDSTVPAVVGALAAVVVIVAIVAAVLLWRRRRAKANGDREVEDGIRDNGGMAGSTYANIGTPVSKERSKTKRAKQPEASVTEQVKQKDDYEDSSEEESDGEMSGKVNLLTADTAVPVETLKTYILQHAADSHFKDEFSSVPMSTNSRQTCGLLPENIKKNRYKNIIPYNRSRVLLQVDQEKNQSDYINASFVRGYKDDRAFIASQGPNDIILNDFVRMLWEHNVDRMVMLTNLVEEGKKKCTMYWPSDGEEEFEEITVKLLTTHVFAEYTIRHLRLSKEGLSSRDVTQFHFTAWPDKSVPESAWGLVDLHQRVMSVPGSGPILVHCSAGVGRTGTFIALCNLLQEAEVTGKMDFLSTLWKLRQDRMHTIQTVAQYAFLHKVALVGHVTAGTTIQVKDINARLASLENGKGGNKSAHSYQQQFEALIEICEATTAKVVESAEQGADNVYQNTGGVVDKRKNRLSNILPNETFRPVLLAEAHQEDTYINAVLVPTLTKDSQDILTQVPMPSTVTDFWRLVIQYNVCLVIAFDTDSSQNDETIGEFLPKSETEPFENERYLVETKPPTDSTLATEFSLTVHQKVVPGMDNSVSRKNKSLTLLQCKGRNLKPESTIELNEKIKSLRPNNNSRIVYMCRNGADQCGLMCVQSILLDRLEADQCLTVPLVVGTIKAIRPQVIPTVDQYQYLYHVLKHAHEAQNVYSNV